ncbi:BTB/POZ domain-containing protein [Alphaentomopoxvirus acuprea]|uniref:BTB/POZ domain-containing protein n=1 Tax=Alphaentomopoxvirus acuprea TaxID=62099 RepID=W6JIU2_9POXV|nr:BTB/POZ domain-containing protein [Anomala cuprea entomopoxvirus]BAO49498.1 BTB/POZ domain-containing protein [Anomala cuprea entomopoxvirus]
MNKLNLSWNINNINNRYFSCLESPPFSKKIINNDIIFKYRIYHNDIIKLYFKSYNINKLSADIIIKINNGQTNINTNLNSEIRVEEEIELFRIHTLCNNIHIYVELSISNIDTITKYYIRNKNLKRIFYMTKFYDVTIITNNHSFNAHKIILSYYSNILYNELNANSNNKKILLKYKPEIINSMLKYLYGFEIDYNNNMNDLLILANELNIKALKYYVENKIYLNMDRTNINEIIEHYDNYSDILQQRINLYINNNLCDIQFIF